MNKIKWLEEHTSLLDTYLNHSVARDRIEYFKDEFKKNPALAKTVLTDYQTNRNNPELNFDKLVDFLKKDECFCTIALKFRTCFETAEPGTSKKFRVIMKIVGRIIKPDINLFIVVPFKYSHILWGAVLPAKTEIIEPSEYNPLKLAKGDIILFYQRPYGLNIQLKLLHYIGVKVFFLEEHAIDIEILKWCHCLLINRRFFDRYFYNLHSFFGDLYEAHIDEETITKEGWYLQPHKDYAGILSSSNDWMQANYQGETHLVYLNTQKPIKKLYEVE